MRYPCNLMGQPAGRWPFQLDPSRPVNAVFNVASRHADRRGTRAAVNMTSLISQVSDHAIFVLRADGTAITCNQGVTELFGYSAKEFTETPIEQLLAVDESTRTQLREQIDHAFDTGLCSVEHWLRRKDGMCIYATGSISRVTVRADETTYLVVVLRNDTPAKCRQEEYELALSIEREARAAAEKANASTNDFLAALSHELRTPLNAILGWAQLLDRETTPEIQQRGRSAIERNARVLAQIAEDLLDQGRLRSGKLHLKFEDTDLRDVATAACAVIEPAARVRGVRVINRIGNDVPRVPADPVRIQQVLWNLLSNGVKFTPRGGTVSLDAHVLEDEVRIEVTDTGCGIDPQRLPHLFNRFHQARDGTRRQDGLGLGLALVKEIVALHGGNVHAESEGEGRGARFVVHLPRRLGDSKQRSNTCAHARELGSVHYWIANREKGASMKSDRGRLTSA